VDRQKLTMAPDPDVWSSLVYAARGSDVRMTMVDGEVTVRDGQLVHDDAEEIAVTARAAARQLASRAGIR